MTLECILDANQKKFEYGITDSSELFRARQEIIAGDTIPFKAEDIQVDSEEVTGIEEEEEEETEVKEESKKFQL